MKEFTDEDLIKWRWKAEEELLKAWWRGMIYRAIRDKNFTEIFRLLTGKI